MTAFEILKRCFTETLALPASIDVTTLRYDESEVWDSVAHMQLVAAIETAFDIMLDTQEVLDMSSFERAAEICRRHGVAFDAG